MDREKIIEAFSFLGEFMTQFQSAETPKKDLAVNDLFYDEFTELIYRAKIYNGWFEEVQVRRSISALGAWLSKEDLTTWVQAYSFADAPKRIGVIMAGNIPLVGFHDFISVLLSGHSILIKQSSDDKHLLSFLAKVLVSINPEFESRIDFTESRMNDFDALIATGSDNSARYFEYYFGKYPNIIRKNRNSVAVLSGKESKEELIALGDDVFAYYGLGCRNVSKVYVPSDYKFDPLFEALYEYRDVFVNKKYANNFDYYRALYLMGGNDMLENGFLLVKEDEALASPISMLHYERYDSLSELESLLNSQKDEIQCVVSQEDIEGSFDLGGAQCPTLRDYADGVDTMAFLSSL